MHNKNGSDSRPKWKSSSNVPPITLVTIVRLLILEWTLFASSTDNSQQAFSGDFLSKKVKVVLLGCFKSGLFFLYDKAIKIKEHQFLPTFFFLPLDMNRSSHFSVNDIHASDKQSKEASHNATWPLTRRYLWKPHTPISFKKDIPKRNKKSITHSLSRYWEIFNYFTFMS